MAEINNVVWLSLGSNFEDGKIRISRVLNKLYQCSDEFHYSSIYRTQEINNPDKYYYNCVASMETNLKYDELNMFFKNLEKEEGRTAESKMKGQVEVDIDIVVYKNKIMRDFDFHQDFFKIGYEQVNMLKKML